MLALLDSRERIFASGFQTAWDVEWSGEPGPGLAKLAWGRVARRLATEAAHEVEHRDHLMVEAAARSAWARAWGAPSQAAPGPT